MKARILTSFFYYQAVDYKDIVDKYFGGVKPYIMADSGAFSAQSQGKPINIDEYARWLLRWEKYFFSYPNLDVIGDPSQSAKNQNHLEREYGLKPLPVFHVGSDFRILEELADQYSYIAIGGLVPHLKFTSRIMPFLVKCFKITQGKAGLHGFGCTNWRIVMSLPWASVDSSSWGSGFRYGKIKLFDIDRGQWHECSIGDKRGVMKKASLFKKLGVDPALIYDRSKNTRQVNAYVNALSFQLAERYLSNRFNNHFKLFLAEDKSSLPGTLGKFNYGEGD